MSGEAPHIFFTTMPYEDLSTDPPRSTPTIIGGVVGGVGSIAIICAAIALYRSSKRKGDISAFESSSVPTVSPSGFADVAFMRKRPLNAHEHPLPLEQPSRNFLVSSKRPLIAPPANVDQGASSTHSDASPPAPVAPAPRNPARAPPPPAAT